MENILQILNMSHFFPSCWLILSKQCHSLQKCMNKTDLEQWIKCECYYLVRRKMEL